MPNNKEMPKTVQALPEVTVRKVLSCAPETAYAAWASEDALKQWWGDWQRFKQTLNSLEYDPRVGGRFLWDHTQVGGERMVVVGEFLRVEPPRLLEFTMHAPEETPSCVRVEFKPHECGCEVVLTHAWLPDAAWCKLVSMGWEDILGRFSREVDGGDAPLTRGLRAETNIALPSAEVYAWLTEADKLTRYFPQRAEMDARAGGEFTFTWRRMEGDGEHVRKGSVRELEPGRRVVWDWWLPSHYSERGDASADVSPVRSTVEWVLEPAPNGTWLSFSHDGWPFGDDYDWGSEFQGHADGWRLYVANLRSVVEGGPDLRRQQPGKPEANS